MVKNSVLFLLSIEKLFWFELFLYLYSKITYKIRLMTLKAQQRTPLFKKNTIM